MLLRKCSINVVSFLDLQITKQDKYRLFPKMIQAIKKVKDSIILVFSPTIVKFNELWINLGEPEKTTGPSGVEWSWFQCSININLIFNIQLLIITKKAKFQGANFIEDIEGKRVFASIL